MKILIAFASLAMCLSFVILPSEQHAPSLAENSPLPDRLLKQSQTNEKDILCVSTLDANQMYCINTHWTVKEYISGRIEVEENRDTLWVKRFPIGHPCPGASYELSMK
jgi:hypothetical protein